MPVTETQMKVAILGAGNGGITAAADLTARGFEVFLYELPEFSQSLAGLRKRGGILLEELDREPVFVPFQNCTTDLAEAVREARVVMLMVPGFAIATFCEKLVPLLQEDQILLFNGAAAMGCVRFAQMARSMGSAKEFLLAETNSLTYGTRAFAAEARVELLLRVKKIFVAAYPQKHLERIFPTLAELYDVFVPARDIWQTTLENGNPEIHPGPCLMNSGRIEYAEGEFYFYKEGLTAHTMNILHGIEQERMAIGRALQLNLEDAQTSRVNRGYLKPEDGATLQKRFNRSRIYGLLKGPLSVLSRYFIEDTEEGLVLWHDLGQRCGVPTPVIDSVITLVGTLLQRDFFASGLTLDKLGFQGETAQDLLAEV